MRSGLHIRATSSTHCASCLCLLSLPVDSPSTVCVRLDIKASPCATTHWKRAMPRCEATAGTEKISRYSKATIVPQPRGRSKCLSSLPPCRANALHYLRSVDRPKCLTSQVFVTHKTGRTAGGQIGLGLRNHLRLCFRRHPIQVSEG